MSDVRIEVDEQVEGLTWLVLDRPEARNAYSEAMVHELVEALDVLEADRGVRCVALTGEGKAVSAGGDLKAMRDHTGMFEGDAVGLRDRYLRGIHRIPRRFARFDKPVIAAVNGAAVGAGLDLACMCDLRIATEGAKMGSTFVKVGLIPGDGGAYLLARTIGFPRALELILSARLVQGEEALRMGLVHELVADADALRDAVRARARGLCGLPPLALRLAKSAAYRSFDLPLHAALDIAASYQGVAQNTADHDEAVAAFLDKRAPSFRGS